METRALKKRKSAEKIAGNEDLLSEILLRLPVRSLIRFKCVSKPWLLLISSTHFSHTHSRRNLSSLPVSGLIFSYLNGFDFVGLDSARPKSSPSLAFMKTEEKNRDTILHSCNGLILCSTSLDDYYACNPTTKNLLPISPPPLAYPDSLSKFGINLVFDPSRSPHFKLVYFTWVVIDPHNGRSPDPDTYSTHLYSSDSQSWSSLENPDIEFLDSAHGHYDPINNGVLCNGSLYWLYPGQWKLLRFAVDEQRFGTITMDVSDCDDNYRDVDYSYCLWQCKGKLCLVEEVSLYDDVPANMVVFEMGNDYSEWFVKYKVKFPNGLSRMDACDDDDKFGTCTILAAIGGQKDDYDDDMLLIRLEYGIRDPTVILILYGVKEKTATKLPWVDFFVKAYPYTESLSPLL